MQKMKYYAKLKNEDGLQFDNNYFNSIKKIKEWARNRSDSSIYDLVIHNTSEEGYIRDIQGYYYIKNNKIYMYK